MLIGYARVSIYGPSPSRPAASLSDLPVDVGDGSAEVPSGRRPLGHTVGGLEFEVQKRLAELLFIGRVQKRSEVSARRSVPRRALRCLLPHLDQPKPGHLRAEALVLIDRRVASEAGGDQGAGAAIGTRRRRVLADEVTDSSVSSSTRMAVPYRSWSRVKPRLSITSASFGPLAPARK